MLARQLFLVLSLTALQSRAQAPAYLVRDINPSTAPSDPKELTWANGKLYFRATTPETGTELFESDGTAEGTGLVDDLARGSPLLGRQTSSSTAVPSSSGLRIPSISARSGVPTAPRPEPKK